MLDAWLVPLGILALTFVGSGLIRVLLRRAGRIRGLLLLQEMAPSFANLAYVVGLMLFADAAPLHPELARWLRGGVYVFGILIIISLARRAALLGIEWTAARTPQSHTLQQGFIPLLRNVLSLFVFFTAAIMILRHFGYDVMSLLTALGVGSLAVGLAAKDTLSNMISGFTLIIDRNLRPGDRISLGGTVGDVDEIGLRSTRLRLGNGNTLIVPNAELVNTRIQNLSQPARSLGCSIAFRVPYSVPFETARDLASAAIGEVPGVLKDPTTRVRLVSLGDTGQQLAADFWVSDLDEEAAAVSEANRRILERLRAAGIPGYS